MDAAAQIRKRWTLRTVNLRRMFIWLLSIGAMYFLRCYLLARWYVSPSRSVCVLPPSAEQVSISNGQYPLPAWATPNLAKGKPNNQTVFILVHGYGGSCQGWTDAFHQLSERGYEVLVPSMPAHGESTDPTCGFGPKESGCVITAARWAREKFVGKKPTVVLVGVSMGAAACWLAVAKEPALFDAISSEDSFAALDEAADQWLSLLLPGGRIILAPVRWFANGMVGLDSSKVRPLDAAKTWHGKPALVVHCESDPLMNASHAERIANAAGTDVWTIPSAGHSEGFALAGEEYVSKLEQLAEKARHAGFEHRAVP